MRPHAVVAAHSQSTSSPRAVSLVCPDPRSSACRPCGQSHQRLGRRCWRVTLATRPMLSTAQHALDQSERMFPLRLSSTVPCAPRSRPIPAPLSYQLPRFLCRAFLPWIFLPSLSSFSPLSSISLSLVAIAFTSHSLTRATRTHLSVHAWSARLSSLQACCFLPRLFHLIFLAQTMSLIAAHLGGCVVAGLHPQQEVRQRVQLAA